MQRTATYQRETKKEDTTEQDKQAKTKRQEEQSKPQESNSTGGRTTHTKTKSRTQTFASRWFGNGRQVLPKFLKAWNFTSLWPPVLAASHRNLDPLNNENFVVCGGEAEKSFSSFFLKGCRTACHSQDHTSVWKCCMYIAPDRKDSDSMVARFIDLFFLDVAGVLKSVFLFVVRVFAALLCVLLVGFVWFLLVSWL